MSNGPKHKILIVDDEQSIREFLDLLLTKENYIVKTAASGVEALKMLENEKFDLVFMDIQMPKMSGIEALVSLKKMDPTTEIIVITAFGTTEIAIDVIKKGAYDFIAKPFKIDNLLMVTKKAIEKKRLSYENIMLKAQLGEKNVYCGMVGSSMPMLMLYEMIKIVSQTTSNILITGESSTGKELIAKAIHTNGPLKNKPFVTVNCGAIPENLIESEMFGHKRGSFTGAVSEKVGLFETANNGTIFLDEVGELPLHLQVKLLRAIQERTIRRVGDNNDININVRLICATNKNLHDMVKKGTFREDLFYRLNVIQIKAPHLRERGDDIVMLSNFFAEKYSHKLQKEIHGITEEAIEALKKYNFPGNVRELENIIERAVALCATKTIKLSDLPPHIIEHYRGQKHPVKISATTVAPPDEIPDGGLELEKLVAEFEKDIINKALRKTNGVKKRAAKLLGITFRSMRYRLEKYNMD
ncbi:MAG: sigma-54 dependent transcriptional regulator [Pseudomonadota bacterium]